MDFYAFLPSNASPQVYPDNKTSDFKIELSKRMELHGQWQAALIELHYPNTIAQVIQGENEITIESDKIIDTVFVQGGCYPNQKAFLSAVREALSALDNKVQTQPFEVTSENRIIFHPLTTEGKLHFSPRLALQLGLDNPGPYPANEKIYGVKPIEIALGIPSQMFIYIDILSDQIIGHTRAPLLRTVPVDITARYGSLSIFHCEHPIYFDLNTKSFDTLKIDIRDNAGRLVPFDFGTSTLLVHFKQV